MNSQVEVKSRNRVRPIDQSAAKTYLVTYTDAGEWMHAPGSDFLFAFIEEGWDAELKQSVKDAFKAALRMSSTIKESVKDTSGDDVVDGLYLLNQTAMTKAMNAIEGMAETKVATKRETGSGTAVHINGEFFTSVLSGLSGNVEPMLTYLTESMGDVQAQAKKTQISQNFGTIIGTISVMPVLDEVVTTFKYAYSSAETGKWFVKVNCASVEHDDYDYSFTVVDYNYTP